MELTHGRDGAGSWDTITHSASVSACGKGGPVAAWCASRDTLQVLLRCQVQCTTASMDLTSTALHQLQDLQLMRGPALLSLLDVESQAVAMDDSDELQ